MSAATHIQIGGIHFAVRCRELPVLPEPWVCYRTFLESEPVAASIRVEIDLQVGGLPDTSRMEKLFDGDSWQLFRSEKGYCLSQAPRGVKLPPAWIACMDSSFTRGVVYCDDVLVRDNQGVLGLVNPILHRLDQLLLMYIYAAHEGVLVHSAGMALDGAGYIFPGRSRAGKSTISRQFLARPDVPKLQLLSDDRIAVRREEGAFQMYGTPWAGDAEVALNLCVPMKAGFFLFHGSENAVRSLTPREAFESLMPVVSLPWYDRELIIRITSVCERLTATVPFFALGFQAGSQCGRFHPNFTAALP